MAKHTFQITQGMEVYISLDDNKMTVTVDRTDDSESPKSAHKAGEPFTGEIYKRNIEIYPSQGLEYAGIFEYPQGNWFVSNTGEAMLDHTAVVWDAPREILRPRTIIRNAEPVKDKPAEPQYKVGDVVELEGTGRLPNGCYKILDMRCGNKGDIVKINNRAVVSGIDEICVSLIVAPMPSTGYYDFLVEGVKCRAYENIHPSIYNGRNILVSFGHGVPMEGRNSNGYGRILDAVDASMKVKLGHGIIPVPYAVSEGNFEAPEV